jgi:predicted transcriptional regulator
MKLGSEGFNQRDFQVVGQTIDIDNFDDKIQVRKSRKVSISYNVNKRGKKMVDRIKDELTLDILTGINMRVGLRLYKFIKNNPSRECLLVKKGTTNPATVTYIAEHLKADRKVVSKCINALIADGIIKKSNRDMYIDPMAYLPLVNDFELRCLMERFDDNFTRELDSYRRELDDLLKKAHKSIKDELDFEDRPLVRTKLVKA